VGHVHHAVTHVIADIALAAAERAGSDRTFVSRVKQRFDQAS
jgi:hypothetical protein